MMPRHGSGQRCFHTRVMLPMLKFVTAPTCLNLSRRALTEASHIAVQRLGGREASAFLKPSDASRSSTSCPLTESCVFKVGRHVDILHASYFWMADKKGFFFF